MIKRGVEHRVIEIQINPNSLSSKVTMSHRVKISKKQLAARREELEVAGTVAEVAGAGEATIAMDEALT